MSSGPIELTEAEMEAAVAVMRRPDFYLWADGGALAKILTAINKVREGDERLTIRKEPGRGRVYIRCEDEETGLPFWLQVDVQGYAHAVGDSIARTVEADYPIVYSPGGE